VRRRIFGKSEGKKSLGRPRCMSEDSIKMDFRELGWDMDWIDLARDRAQLVNTAMNLRVQ
jgi:hypothetical protein